MKLARQYRGLIPTVGTVRYKYSFETRPTSWGGNPFIKKMRTRGPMLGMVSGGGVTCGAVECLMLE